MHLQKQSVGKTGTVFILNSKKELIAHKDPAKVTHTVYGNESAKLKRIDKTDEPYLKIANSSIIENNLDIIGIRDISQFLHHDVESGEKYFVSFTPLGYLDWVVCTIVPENDFMAEIRENINRLFFVVLFFVIVAALLALFISRKFIDLLETVQRLKTQQDAD